MWKVLDINNDEMLSKFIEIQNNVCPSCTYYNNKAYIRLLKDDLFLYEDGEHEMVLGFTFVPSRDNYTITHSMVGKTTDINKAKVIFAKKIEEFLKEKGKNAMGAINLNVSTDKANEWFGLVFSAFEGLDVKVKVTDKIYEFTL
jgi:hypothetical protein